MGQAGTTSPRGFRPTHSSALSCRSGNPSNVYVSGSVPQNGGPPSFVTPGAWMMAQPGNTKQRSSSNTGAFGWWQSLLQRRLHCTASALFPTKRTAGQGILRSTDGGQSWTALDTGLPSSALIVSVVLDPKDPAAIYWPLSFLCRGRRHPQKHGWRKKLGAISTGLPSNTPIQSLAIDPVSSSTMYLIADGSFLKSTDGGSTLEQSRQRPGNGERRSPGREPF